MKQIWNEDFNAGYEVGYKDGESSAYADATAKYEDEIDDLIRELNEARCEVNYWQNRADDIAQEMAYRDYD